MTLYLKYRPQKINDLDIKEVREGLTQIVKSRQIPHAFLFSGPKGTGKTSAARILAKIVNCESLSKNGEPCDKCAQCTSIIKGNNLDVIELDAASHRGIDDIRALREAVKLSPSQSKRKVYIIDEAHMLTLEASNALLKTLEEPPEHVLFILATTNPEKLPETVRSRTTQIDFRKATGEEIVNSLKRVVKGEKIKISDPVLNLIAIKAGGSFRDATKILEQLISEKQKLDEKNIEEYLFSHKGSQVEQLIKILADQNTQSGIKFIEDLVAKGISLESFFTDVLSVLKKSLLAKVGLGKDEYEILTKDEVLTLIKLFGQAISQAKFATIEQLPFEIVIIEWGSKKEDSGQSDKEENDPKKGESEFQRKEGEIDLNGINLSEKGREDTKDSLTANCVSAEVWQTILSKVRPLNASIEALLRATRPMAIDGGIFKLGVFYKFHKERLEENKNRRVFEDVLSSVLGKQVRIVCALVEPPSQNNGGVKKMALTNSQDQDIIDAAEEIFNN